MKSRLRKVLNFFAFNLLFFALYLNFIHKDKGSLMIPAEQHETAAFSGSLPVRNSAPAINHTPAVTEAGESK